MRLDQNQQKRVHEALKVDLGAVVAHWLLEPACEDIVLNPDGRILVKCLREDWQHVGDMNEGSAEWVIMSIAALRRIVITDDHPIVETIIPENGSRFEGILPPLTERPVFSIRKRAQQIYTLADYVADGIMTSVQASTLKRAVQNRDTLLVSGATGSGKTTLLNALLAELSAHAADDRVIVLEETPELQCAARNSVFLLASPPAITLTTLLATTLRMRPTRIIVGEVRGAEALAMLKAFNTGHPGGLSTIHANSPEAALLRLNSLVREAIPSYDATDLIQEAIQVVVQIDGPRLGVGRRITSILSIHENEHIRSRHIAINGHA